VGRITGARLSVDVDLTPGATDLASVSLGGADAPPMPVARPKILLDGPRFDAIEADVAIAAGSLAAVSISPHHHHPIHRRRQRPHRDPGAATPRSSRPCAT